MKSLKDSNYLSSNELDFLGESGVENLDLRLVNAPSAWLGMIIVLVAFAAGVVFGLCW